MSITNWIAYLVLPPAINFLLIFIAILIRPFFKKLSKFFVFISFVSLLIFCAPYISNQLITSLQKHPALTLEQINQEQNAEAIVVLSASTEFSPEYATHTVGSSGLKRLLYAAWLHKQTDLPILIAGGIPKTGHPSQAETMADVLNTHFATPTKWLEKKSETTFENVKFTKEILEKENIKRIYVITNAWHMPRAIETFKAFGLDPIPAPTAFIGKISTPEPEEFFPTADALEKSNIALHEYLGIIWYRFLPHTSESPAAVIPAKAGIQGR